MNNGNETGNKIDNGTLKIRHWYQYNLIYSRLIMRWFACCLEMEKSYKRLPKKRWREREREKHKKSEEKIKWNVANRFSVDALDSNGVENERFIRF